MERSITVIYEDGVLRPLIPLALPEHSRVRVRIELAEEQPRPSECPGPAAWSDEERAQRLRIVRQLYGLWSEEDAAAFERLQQEMWSQWLPRDLS